MTSSKGSPRKKPRITDEQVTEMKRLFREGKTISAIARTMGCHRQTVSMHIAEKHMDLVADEVRKQILAEELRNHFNQLATFAQVDFKLRLDASVPEHQRQNEPRATGSIVTGGILGLPYVGGVQYMAKEWTRMYKPPPKEGHLLKSLRAHTMDSTMWIHWDRWRRKVADYENASKKLWEWLEERTEEDLLEKIDPLRIDSSMGWLVGNILRTASGGEQEDLATFQRNMFDAEGMIVGRDPNKDIDGSLALYKLLSGMLEEAQSGPEWTILQSATTELKSKESQLELRRIAKEIDYALVSIELMNAFPGHCELCPV